MKSITLRDTKILDRKIRVLWYYTWVLFWLYLYFICVRVTKIEYSHLHEKKKTLLSTPYTPFSFRPSKILATNDECDYDCALPDPGPNLRVCVCVCVCGADHQLQGANHFYSNTPLVIPPAALPLCLPHWYQNLQKARKQPLTVRLCSVECSLRWSPSPQVWPPYRSCSASHPAQWKRR